MVNFFVKELDKKLFGKVLRVKWKFLRRVNEKSDRARAGFQTKLTLKASTERNIIACSLVKVANSQGKLDLHGNKS